MKQSNPKLNYWILLAIFSGLFISCGDFASDERKNVNLALKTGGKTYLFSSFGTMITKNKLNHNESPPILPATRIISKGDDIYTESQYIEDIVDLISENIVLHNYSEKSFDGYVTAGENRVFKKKYSNQSTEKIGKMISTVNIYLTDLAQTKEHHISWQRKPNQTPLKNCNEMSIWVDRSYRPGEQVAVKEDYILINLNSILEFYDSNVKLDYVEDEEILYVIID